jgi:ATP-dependent exoDNAse (exonuclease V) alpha subunit
MMDSLTANRLLKTAQQQGNVVIRLVGDTGQHSAIQAGNPVEQFIQAEMTVARLETIRRQDTEEMREVVRAARYTPAEAFDMLDEQGRITEIADGKERFAAIADEYLKGRRQGNQTLVVSPGNDERREINATIRQKLVEAGLVKDSGHEQEILVDRRLTPAQVKSANSYQQNDVILVRGSREQQKRGLKKNAYAVVEKVDRHGNALTVRTEDGRHVEVYPAKWEGKDAEVFSKEQRTLAVGDSVQFRRPEKRHGIANGEFATVVKLNNDGARFHFEGKVPRNVDLPFTAMRHLDHGYCSTTYSAQGATVEKCIIQADSMRGEKLLNRSGWYVGVSRPKADLMIFTDDADALRRAVSRDPKKQIALEAIKQTPNQQQQQPSMSMRI